MASKAFIRSILVAALVVTAHTIKPFTFGSVALQALGTARSLSFVMPEAAAERIEHAHYLAHIYSKGLFDDTDSSWTQQNMLRSGLVAFANSVETYDDADIKDVKPGDVNRKSAPKRPVKRIKRDENRDEDSGCTKNNEIAQLPDVRAVKTVSYLPSTNAMNYQPRFIKARFIPTAGRTESETLRAMLADCSSIELPVLKTTALIHHSSRLHNQQSLKVALVLVSRPSSLTAVCRDASVTKTEAAEAPVEIVIGPEESEAETEVVAEEEQEAPAPPTVEIRIPQTPECIRIP